MQINLFCPDSEMNIYLSYLSSSDNTMSYKAPSEFASHILVHFGIVELVIEELLGHLAP